MAFTELELKRCEKAIATFLQRHRPPPHIRPKLDIECRITNQSVEVFEIRPDWSDRNSKTETPIAKATFIQTKERWRVYWMRRDLRWHGYETDLEVRDLDGFFAVVGKDEYGCFFG